MRPRLVQWIVLFFTRPIRLSDVAALLRRVKPVGRKAAAADTIPAEPAANPKPRRPEKAGEARATSPSLLHTDLEVSVSEQPLDTLPAELQSELVDGAARQARSSRSAAERAGGEGK
jgi:hypothetical protein